MGNFTVFDLSGSDAVQKPVFECKDDSSFPWILDVFEIQPFDFFKVIDSFIQADDALPSAVVKVLSNGYMLFNAFSHGHTCTYVKTSA